MIGGKARNHFPALALPGRNRPLAGELDAGFDRFRTAGNEEYLVQTFRHTLCGHACQIFRRFVFEMQAIGEGHAVHLLLHGIEHVAIAMADIDHHRAARSVDDATSVLIPDVDALGAIHQRPAQARLVEKM